MSAIAATTAAPFFSYPFALDAAREPRTGRFVPAGRLWAVRMVALPGGVQGWQVGPGGMTFKDKAAAERFAARRQGRSIKV